jgi:DNA-binding NtrC family response regulator
MALPINILIICAGKEEQAKFTEMVRMAGMRAVCCANLQEARVILARQEIHAVICEEILPDGSFHDVIEQVRPASEELPVIVFSNSSEWDTYLRVMRAGAFDCIAYPPESAEVARILWQALRQSKQHIEMAMAAS